ncbi:hypothetical protein SAMN04488564_107411 [Lentzea waywayandensis]|uniref:Uncharacterized protein n=1 Tax=Lentzea waywayandensis TaxID=84724 RepID=A0A1I6F301_9PSEU|nr:hypothetical protein [Lentzea waywayandensis]SFR24318.1 hypothetical protein SAMN04488564_107411 [Lentzea waywayandensis]
MQAAVGVAFVAWVAAFSALTEAGNPQVLVAAAVSGGLVCLCAVAGGVVATRITDAASAARLRHVFVVLEGAAAVIFFPFYWFASSVEPVGRPGDFALVAALVLLVPVVAALVLVLRSSFVVHKIVVGEFGPLVPVSADYESAHRIRVLGTVLVVAGAALSVSVVALAFTAPSRLLLLEVYGLLVTLTPVVLGLSLAREKNVYTVRRRNIVACMVIPAAVGWAAAKVASIGGGAGMLFSGLVFAATVLLVVAILVVREFSAVWDRPSRRREVSP